MSIRGRPGRGTEGWEIADVLRLAMEWTGKGMV
jgi:hypothetical protein